MAILNKTEITNFWSNGFCVIKAPNKEYYSSWIDLSKSIHDAPSNLTKSIDVTKSLGLRGYYSGEIEKSLHCSDAEKKRKYSSFDFGFENNTSSRFEIDNILHAKNQWPKWLSGYEKKCRYLLSLWNYLAVSLFSDLTLKDSDYINKYFSCPTGNMRFLKYHENDGKQSLIHPHRDYEFLTIVSSQNDGLEIKDINGNFLPVKTSKDDLILMAGDGFEYLTNGDVRAAEHRVVCSDLRYSCVYFLCSNSDVFIDKSMNFYSNSMDNKNSFCPAEHVAIMHLMNYHGLRSKYIKSDIYNKIPRDGKNPFYNGLF